MLYTAYLHTPTVSEMVENKSLYEALYKTLRNNFALRIFVTEEIMFTYKRQRRTKLSDRPSTGVYVGMRNGLFPVSIPYTKGIIRTRHISFDETENVYNVRTDLEID